MFYIGKRFIDNYDDSLGGLSGLWNVWLFWMTIFRSCKGSSEVT